MRLTAGQASRLLSNNYDEAHHSQIKLDGDSGILSTLTTTRAIIGIPK